MPISAFSKELREALSREQIPGDLVSEADLERRFVVPVACELVARHADVLVYTHPFGGTSRCQPHCVHESPATGRVFGCPRCWTTSKAWASRAAFGTHHSFDLVARDNSHTLALEAKLSRASGGRMPNGEIQRFLGQCALAAVSHSEVIGFFAHRGELNQKWHRDTKAATDWFDAHNVRLVFRAI